MKRQTAHKIALGLLGLVFLFCPDITSAATPQITVSASAVTLLGSNQTISITATLIDPNQTGLLRVLPNIIPPSSASTVTPGTTATVGPIFGTDVILDGRGNANTTVYKIQVFTVSNGIVASTPSLQNFFQFAGSGTVDLSTATPVTPAFFSGPSGSASILGTLTATQLISTVATGTAPLVVSSTTQVANLNASQLGGLNPPASAIVGVTDTQTLTGKTYDTAGSGNTFKINGTQISAVTGSGSAVLATSPTLTTPIVGSGAAIGSSGAGGTMASVSSQSSAATNFGAALSAQTIIASVPNTDTVRVTVLAVQTRVGVGCSASSNTVTPNVAWTGPGGTAQNGNLPLQGITGNGALDNGSGLQAGSGGAMIIVAKAGTAVTYTTASSLGSSGCSTTPQYTIFAKALY